MTGQRDGVAGLSWGGGGRGVTGALSSAERHPILPGEFSLCLFDRSKDSS